MSEKIKLEAISRRRVFSVLGLAAAASLAVPAAVMTATDVEARVGNPASAVSVAGRDRLHSERILESRLLIRHIDYDIDYAAGTLRFREPILSRSSALDPQFIVADYEVDGVASRELNAGGRVAWRSADQRLQVAATAIHDNDGTTRTNLGGVDVRFRPTPRTEIRAEVAVSDTRATGGGNAPAASGAATAWQVEVEHHDRRFDLLAYAREREAGFGVGQLNASENGTRKIGIDARARLTETLSLTGSAWHEDYLDSDARRIAGRALIEYRGRDFSARAGLTIADDRLADGRRRQLADPPARRDPALLRQSARARRADRAADRRQRRQHRFPGPPPPLRALRGEPQRRPDRLLRNRRRREDQRPHRADRLRARALGRRAHRAHRQYAEYRRIWAAQLRRLRPVADL